MAQPPTAGDDLQFDRAEFVAGGAEGVINCTRCNRRIADAYFTLAADVLCASCAGAAAAALRGGSAAGRVVRAVFLGGIAGGIGAGIYYGVAALTGYEIGLVALVVGFLVGMAVRIGSRARGGWFYQLLAVGLTYVAIGVSYLIAVMQEVSRHPELAATSAPSDGDATAMSPALVLATLVAFALALPVLYGMQSPLVFIIMAFALFEAWRLNRVRAPTVEGPYRIAPTAASAVSASAPPPLPPEPPHG